MSSEETFNSAKLIEEVKLRPGLFQTDQPVDRTEKLHLWKEVGASMYPDWKTFNKARAYDKVLKLQRKWRSLRDAYNRELRKRRSGVRKPHRRVYKYFKRMSFLGGYSGTVSEEENPPSPTPEYLDDRSNEELEVPIESEDEPKRTRKKQRRRRSSSSAAPEEVEMPVFPLEMTGDDGDSDRLFMLSFLPEMRQLPGNLKMWVRAQIATAMQEAVHCHYTNTQPSDKSYGEDVKRPRYGND